MAGDGTVPTFTAIEEADIFCGKLNGDLQGKDLSTEDLPETLPVCCPDSGRRSLLYEAAGKGV